MQGNHPIHQLLESTHIMKIKGSRLAVAAVAVAAFGAASAASLGGLSSAEIGSDNTVVAACDETGVDLDYTTAYDSVSGTYQVTEAIVSDIAVECDGQTLDLTLSADGGASIDDGTVVVTGTTETIPMVASAEAVEGAAVIISSDI
jgi:hypothetical protein